jgi:hypothetical protein
MQGDNIMLRFFQMIMLFSISLFVMISCSTMKVEKQIIKKDETSSVHEEVVIEPNKMYEECVEALPEHYIMYSFKASKPLDFNIHYHGEENIHYPVSQKLVSEWCGVLDVREQGYYIKDQEFFCLMWENPHAEEVKVIFDCKVEEKSGP